jgi:hypothetical protein
VNERNGVFRPRLIKNQSKIKRQTAYIFFPIRDTLFNSRFLLQVDTKFLNIPNFYFTRMHTAYKENDKEKR